MRISFVILHYNTFEDTVKCVESILKLTHQSTEDISIIVVDNGSPNGTGDLLKKKYGNTEKIDVLLLKKNMGFASGNNVGFVFANKNYHPDFIVLSNNDIVISQKNFIDKMIELYNVNHFAVLGPSIYAPYKRVYQNPLRDRPYTVGEIEELIRNYQNKIKLFKLLDRLHCYSFLHGAKHILKKINLSQWHNSEKKFQVVLHGAFLIMSREYIDIFPGGLCDKTFMYMEEDILYHMCINKNLKMMYSPEIQVLHNEGAATRNVFKSRAKKSIFEFENTIKSANILLDMLKENDYGDE